MQPTNYAQFKRFSPFYLREHPQERQSGDIADIQMMAMSNGPNQLQGVENDRRRLHALPARCGLGLPPPKVRDGEAAPRRSSEHEREGLGGFIKPRCGGWPWDRLGRAWRLRSGAKRGGGARERGLEGDLGIPQR